MRAESTATGVIAVHSEIAVCGIRRQAGMRTGPRAILVLVGTRLALVRVVGVRRIPSVGLSHIESTPCTGCVLVRPWWIRVVQGPAPDGPGMPTLGGFSASGDVKVVLDSLENASTLVLVTLSSAIDVGHIPYRLDPNGQSERSSNLKERIHRSDIYARLD